MQSSYQHALPVGTRIDNYEIRSILGIGGFGITYRAYDRALDCDVAIKEYLPVGLAVRGGNTSNVLPKSEQDGEQYGFGLGRFLDEARTLARFHDPSIVRVSRYLEANGTAYIVMDFVDGEALSERLQRRGRLEEPEVRDMLVPLLDGLGRIHEQGVLHRDIKPANVYVRRDGTPVLLDFGAARLAVGRSGESVTGLVTHGYAPFEQYLTRTPLGPWTDLYALGATAVHCVTGRTPTPSTERMAAVHKGAADPVAEVIDGSGLSNEFARIILWMAAPDADQRPRTALEVTEQLRGGNGRSTTVSGNSYEPTMLVTEPPRPGATRQEEWPAQWLAQVEACLARHVGPIAAVLIDDVKGSARDERTLFNLLAEAIPGETERSAFLAAAAGIPRSGPPGREVPVRTGTVDAGASIRVTRAGDEKRLMPVIERIRRIADELVVNYIGPIAPEVCAQVFDEWLGSQRPTPSAMRYYIQRLSEYIPDPAQRAQFQRETAARVSAEIRPSRH